MKNKRLSRTFLPNPLATSRRRVRQLSGFIDGTSALAKSVGAPAIFRVVRQAHEASGKLKDESRKAVGVAVTTLNMVERRKLKQRGRALARNKHRVIFHTVPKGVKRAKKRVIKVTRT